MLCNPCLVISHQIVGSHSITGGISQWTQRFMCSHTADGPTSGNTRGSYGKLLSTVLQHPNTTAMQEEVTEMVKKFFANMEYHFALTRAGDYMF